MRLVPIDRDGISDPALDITHELVSMAVAATIDLYGRKGFVPPWIGYLAVEDGRVVGCCGFAAPPHDGQAEIAYFTLPELEGRGFGTRIAAELMRLTRPEADRLGVRFIAHTLPEESASTTILKRLGFEFVGPIDHPEDGTVWKWREGVDNGQSA